jgi:hypothetical protein
VLDPEFRTDFRRYWENKGKPANGSMLSIDYQYLTDLFAEIKGNSTFSGLKSSLRTLPGKLTSMFYGKLACR